MNDAKCMVFIACGLMMNVMVHGMKLEKLNESCISQDRIFVWSSRDHQYHAVTQFGVISEYDILQKNDQPHKIYRTQLIINKKEEGAEYYKYSLKTTQESIDGGKTHWKNLRKPERIVMPIFSSQAQYSIMWSRLRSCLDRKKAVLVMDNDNNEYFITHIWDENRDKPKTVRIYNTQQFRAVTVPVLNKKKILLQLDTLKKDVAELKELAKEITQPTLAQRRQMLIDRRNWNIFIAKIIGGTSVLAIIAALYYACNQLMASNH